MQSKDSSLTSIENAVSQLKCIASGNYSQVTKPKSDNDKLGMEIFNVAKILSGVVGQANAIARGDGDAEIVPRSEKDELGAALYEMTKVSRDESLILKALWGLVNSKDENIFDYITESMAAILQVEYVFISFLPGKGEVETISFFADGEITDTFKYDLVYTPCNEVVKCNDICVFPDNLKKSFLKDPYIDDMGVVSYVGSSLTNKNNKVIGLMSVMSKTPILDVEKVKKIFSVFRSRACIELERELFFKKAMVSELRLKAVVESSPISILIVDKRRVITFHNKESKVLFEYEGQELIGQDIKMLIPHKASNRHFSIIDKYIRSPEKKRLRLDLNVFGCKRSGALVPIDITLTPLDESHIMCSIIDISERTAYVENLMKLSMVDDLTGLPNRKAFTLALQQALARAERNNTFVALLYMDVDNFKDVNDLRGHNAGDDLLVLIGRSFLTRQRKGDFVARIGGDEFVALVENISSSDEGGEIANSIIDKLSEITIDNALYKDVSISIGISIYPISSKSSEHLLEDADRAMYEAKRRHGSSAFYFSTILNDKYYRIKSIKNQLKNIIINNELSLLYQPIVDISTNEVVGMEALSRWNNAELGNVPPDEFIPIAESGAIINEITSFILNKACKDFSTLPRSKTLELSVNLSYWDLMDEGLAGQVLGLLDKYKIKPENLILEITESTNFQNNEITTKNLSALSKSRVRFALDDFGTGNSSFSLINSLPISILKIDKSFLLDINSSTKSEKIIISTIKLGKSLSYDVIAEGVETKEQLTFLKKHAGSFAQGYYFHKPMPIKNILTLLNA